MIADAYHSQRSLRPARCWLVVPRMSGNNQLSFFKPFKALAMSKTPARKPIYKSLYAQVIFAVTIGVLLGHFYPQLGTQMKPFGDGFIKLIKMIIAPIIFCTVVIGIAGMEDMKKVGKTGGLALLYFEIMSTVALILGMIVVNVWHPGTGMHIDLTTLDTKSIAAYTGPGKMESTVDFFFHI